MTTTTLDALATALQGIFEALNTLGTDLPGAHRKQFDRNVKSVQEARVLISQELWAAREGPEPVS